MKLYHTFLGRYKSKLHGTMPVMLHFPGKNMTSFREFYTNTHSVLVSQEPTVENVGWIILVVIILLIILLVFSNMIMR